MFQTNNIKKFFRLASIEKKMFVEAVVVIALTSALFKLVPFHYLSKLLGMHMAASVVQLVDIDREVSEVIGLSVRQAAKSLPWKPACFPQAMAAKFMLRKRDIVSTLFLGVKKNESGGLSAHAWLSAGNYVVTGASGEEDFKIVASFC